MLSVLSEFHTGLQTTVSALLFSPATWWLSLLSLTSTHHCFYSSVTQILLFHSAWGMPFSLQNAAYTSSVGLPLKAQISSSVSDSGDFSPL